jgi:hypothetical protein
MMKMRVVFSVDPEMSVIVTAHDVNVIGNNLLTFSDIKGDWVAQFPHWIYWISLPSAPSVSEQEAAA